MRAALLPRLVIGLGRRRLAHVAVTAHPTAARTAQQLREGFPITKPHGFSSTMATAPRSPNDRQHGHSSTPDRIPLTVGDGYVGPVIGSIRRECLDHVIVLDEADLRRILAQYVAYYQKSRTRLGLAKAPRSRGPSPPPSARSSPIRKSAGCINVTIAASHKHCGARHRRRHARRVTPCMPGHRTTSVGRYEPISEGSLVLRAR